MSKVSSTQYAKALFELTVGKSHSEIDEVVGGFAELLAKKNQKRLLPKIIEKFSEIYNKENGIVEAEVISRDELREEVRTKVRTMIRTKYKAKEVLINNIVNESIKGGIIIRVGDEVMDGSIDRQLQNLKKELAI